MIEPSTYTLEWIYKVERNLGKKKSTQQPLKLSFWTATGVRGL